MNDHSLKAQREQTQKEYQALMEQRAQLMEMLGSIKEKQKQMRIVIWQEKLDHALKTGKYSINFSHVLQVGSDVLSNKTFNTLSEMEKLTQEFHKAGVKLQEFYSEYRLGTYPELREFVETRVREGDSWIIDPTL